MILRFTKWAVLALPLFAGGMATSPSGDVVAPPPPAELEAAPDPEEAGAPSAELITRTADDVARLLVDTSGEGKRIKKELDVLSKQLMAPVRGINDAQRAAFLQFVAQCSELDDALLELQTQRNGEAASPSTRPDL